jgi:type IV pilus assembly protein PilY1
VSPGPLFTTVTGQPITTVINISSGATTAGANTIVLTFGTGNRTQFNNANPVQFAGTTPAVTQSLYGVWDWNMSSWNSKSGTQYASLTTAAANLPGAGYTVAPSNLLAETFALNSDSSTRDIAGTAPICWAGTPTCAGNPQFGWKVAMFGNLEQVVYNPQLVKGVFTVNSIVPANNQPNSCVTNNDQGYTYAIAVLTGAAVPGFFVSFHDTQAVGIRTDAVGTSFPVTSSTGALWLVSQTVTNQPILTQVNPGANGKGRRLTWVQLR